MRYRVVHRIEASFAERASGACFALRLTARDTATQSVEFHQVLISPEPATRAEESTGFSIDRPFDRLAITALTTVRFVRAPTANTSPARDLLQDLGILREGSPRNSSRAPGRCRTLAEAALVTLRAAGVRADYVAGYRLSAAQPRTLPHAWISLDLSAHGGSVAFDPTTREFVDEVEDARYLELASGAGYESTQPIQGSLGARGSFRLSSSVLVERLAAHGSEGRHT